MRELEKVQLILERDRVSAEERVSELKRAIESQDSRLCELLEMRKSAETRVSELTESIRDSERGLEKAIGEKAKRAFCEYMAEQAGTFEKIARTYGKTVLNSLILAFFP